MSNANKVGKSMAPASRRTTARPGIRACNKPTAKRARTDEPCACPSQRRAEDIILAALSAQRKREGVRVKVRLSDKLAVRARECAADVDMLLGDWVNCACRNYLAGRRVDVAESEKSELATRSGSECFTIRAPVGMTAAEIKRAVLMACAYCEALRIVYNPQPVGRYIFESSEK